MLDGFGQAPVCIELDLDSYDGPWTHVERFRNRRGWLMVANAVMTAPDGQHEFGMVVGCDEWGEAIPAWQAAHLLDCACSLPQPCDEYAPSVLEVIAQREAREVKLRWLRENNRDLLTLAQTVEAAVAAEEHRTSDLLDRTLANVDDLRRRRRSPLLTADNRVAIDEAIASLEIGVEAALHNLEVERGRIRSQAADKERQLLQRAAVSVEIEPAYVVSWHDGAPACAGAADQTADFDWRPPRVEFTYEATRRNAWWRDRAEGKVDHSAAPGGMAGRARR